MYGQVSTLIDMIENGTEGNPTIDDVFSAFKIFNFAGTFVHGNQACHKYTRTPVAGV